MKQLFLKSNILHIRTNEGEFEVSNPEIIGDPETIKIIFNDGKPFGGMPIEPVWPGGVELNWRIAISTARDTKYTSCTEEYAKSNPGFHSYAVARLLPPKEEKKDFETVLGDSIKAHGINNDLPGHLIEPDFLFPKHTVLGQGYHIKKDYNKLTESAYKEFEKPTPLHDMQVAMGQIVESSEPYFESILDYIDDQYLLNFNKGLIDLNELEKRTRNAIELYIESEIKALREENTKCKELSWEAANEISRLKKEIERLEAEVLKEKFPEN